MTLSKLERGMFLKMIIILSISPLIIAFIVYIFVDGEVQFNITNETCLYENVNLPLGSQLNNSTRIELVEGDKIIIHHGCYYTEWRKLSFIKWLRSQGINRLESVK